MKGIVLVNANYDTPSTRYQSKRLVEELVNLGVEVEIVKNDGSLCTIGKANDFDFDFCLFLDKDVHTARFLELSGVKVFNSAEAIRICDDKVATYLSLLDLDVRIPVTISGTYTYKKTEVSKSKLDYIESILDYPVVIKLNSSSLGEGVYLAKNRYALEQALYNLSGKPHHVQEFIRESKGEDYRIIVVGGKVVASISRHSDSDFRSNVELGGEPTPISLPREYVEVAERVARRLNLDYCGIDLLKGKDGPILCEVNSNAFFGGVESVTGINVAEAYARYVIDILRG